MLIKITKLPALKENIKSSFRTSKLVLTQDSLQEKLNCLKHNNLTWSSNSQLRTNYKFF